MASDWQEKSGRRRRKLFLPEFLFGIGVIVGLSASRASKHEWVGHPVLNLRGSLPFFAKMHEYVDRPAISSLAAHDDVEMRHSKNSETDSFNS